MSFTVFGYGSLVNKGTLGETLAVRRHTLPGWRRTWRAASRTPVGGVCAISAEPDDECAIDGLFITFPDGLWEAMLARERRYDPVPIAGGLTFRARPEIDVYGDADHPISLSYLDTIAQGFLAEFGDAGLERFVATTDGWHVPILNDRAAPRYPRAQRLSAHERGRVDAILASVDATVLSAEDMDG